MTVGDIMTRNVIACRRETDIGTAARLMQDGRVGTLPVVDAGGAVAGIITDRDVAIAAATRQRNAAHIAVHEAMSPHVRSCAAAEPIRAALAQMAQARVRRLPVVDEHGHLTGILSLDDLVVRALDVPGGIPAAAFVAALRTICTAPSAEPELNPFELAFGG